jgi:hypothetical protein
LRQVASRSRKNSKKASMRSGVGGGATPGESLPTWRAALNSSTGSASRTPNHAWISAALRAARNEKNPLNTET